MLMYWNQDRMMELVSDDNNSLTLEDHLSMKTRLIKEDIESSRWLLELVEASQGSFTFSLYICILV